MTETSCLVDEKTGLERWSHLLTQSLVAGIKSRCADLLAHFSFHPTSVATYSLLVL